MQSGFRNVAAVYAENLQLRARVEQLTARVEVLLAQLAEQNELIARQNERIAELVAIAQRKKAAPPKPPKPPQPPPDVSEDEQARFEGRPPPPEEPAKPKEEKGKQRPTGRKPLPEHLEVEPHVVKPEVCECCGSQELDIVDEVVEEKLHVVKEHQRRRVVRRKTGRCRKCTARTTARSLPAPFPRSKVTCEWLAWLVWMKFALLVPLDRIRRDLATRNVKLSISFLVSQIERAADLLSAVDGVHWTQLLKGTWMATDATGLKVLVPGLKGTQHGHIEVYRRDKLVVMQYEASKDGETIAEKLKPFKGTLLADAEARYNAVFADSTVREAGCNAHPRRKLRDAEAVQPVLAKEAGAFVAAMFIAEAKARERGIVGDELKAWRQANIRPVVDKFRQWIDAVAPTLVPSDPLAAVIRYYRNHWDALFRFIDHPEIPIDNSGCEREFQSVAKLRLNCLFAGGTEGAHRAAILLGIVATCKALDVNAQSYLTWAFERLGTHEEVFGLRTADLTPAAFKLATS